MSEVAKGVGTFPRVGVPVFQDGELIRDGLDHAATRAAEPFENTAGGTSGNVDVVPGPILGLAAHIVSPGRRIGEQVEYGVAAIAPQARIDGILRQQLLNQLPSFGGKMPFRDQSNSLMALATPSFCGGNERKGR